MRTKLKGGVAYAGAQVIDLAAWREGSKPKPQTGTAFPTTDQPGMDFNEMGHGLKLAARYVGEGRMTPKQIAKLLDGLSVNAHAACQVGHEMQYRLSLAERVLSRQFGGIEGKALRRAIHAAANEAKKATNHEKREARKAEREGR